LITDLYYQLLFQLLFIGAGCWFYHKKSISASGLLFLILSTGALIWTLNNETIAAIVMMFVFSTWATRYKEADKQSVHKRLAESGPRNWKQGFANLGPACLLALGSSFTDEIGFIHAAFASIAAATADTFASEIGVLSKNQPYFILSRKKVPPGISGGVTLLGMSASAAGAVLIALTHVYFFKDPWIAAMIIGLGILGSVIDSVIGEVYQVLYVNRSGDWVESTDDTEKIKGVRWMTNNVVNGITTTAVGVIGYLLARGCF
jgi:uncharacterized protein (TIGR00297 family)